MNACVLASSRRNHFFSPTLQKHIFPVNTNRLLSTKSTSSSNDKCRTAATITATTATTRFQQRPLLGTWCSRRPQQYNCDINDNRVVRRDHHSQSHSSLLLVPSLKGTRRQELSPVKPQNNITTTAATTRRSISDFLHITKSAARMSTTASDTGATTEQPPATATNTNMDVAGVSGAGSAGNDDGGVDVGSDNNNNKRNTNNYNNKNKRKSNQSKHRTSWQAPNKRSKKEKKKNHTWRPSSNDGEKQNDDAVEQDASGKDGAVDYTTKEPSTGSFAHAALREEFGVTLWKDDEEKKAVLQSSEKANKRKVAMLIGFLGTKYGGFQSNPNQRTLQAEIELAMFRNGMIAESNFGFPHKYSWSNAARTDKGVHACAQVCSAKVALPDTVWDDPSGQKLDQVRDRLNELLPDDIRVMDIVRTTRTFCGKTARDRVRYQYMIPSFLLHPDWRSLFEQNGITGNRQLERDTATDEATASEGQDKSAYGREPYLSKDEIQKIQTALTGYRSTEESRRRLQQALDKYRGTKQYQSFTRGLKAGQAQAARYIENFIAQDPIVVNDVEWIPTEVLGQSFLLHQIRKMISVAVDVARGAAPLDFLDRALTKETLYKINVAPAQGLFLEMSYYGGYNRHKDRQNAGRLPNLDWTVPGPAHDRWSAMRDVIRNHIIQEETELGSFVHYMYVQEFVFGVRECYRLDTPPAPASQEVDGNSK